MTTAPRPSSSPVAGPKLHGGSLQVRDVSVSFAAHGNGRLVALERLSLRVGPGEIVALIGPNGSGKSTLLRVMAGLLTPDRGEVLVDEEPISGPDPRIGLDFQEARLLPWRTTARNIAYPLELAGWRREDREERLADLLHVVGLTDSADSLPAHLSGGMRQRAALARTLALRPEVLLMDEPFSALDELTRERFNVELLKLWSRRPMTIVVVTHSVAEAVFLADRVVVLSERPGRVVADVPIELPRPRSLATLDQAVVTAAAAEIRRSLGGLAA